MAEGMHEHELIRGEVASPGIGEVGPRSRLEPEIRMDARQAASMARLVKGIAEDRNLRFRIQEDPRAVLQAYGLANLVENRGVQMKIDITALHDKVDIEGVAFNFLGFHIDAGFGHRDNQTHNDGIVPHTDAGGGHSDSTHSDRPAVHIDL